MAQPRFYTLSELESLLRVGRTTLWRMRRDDVIPGRVRRGRRTLYFAPMVDRWLEGQIEGYDIRIMKNG